MNEALKAAIKKLSGKLGKKPVSAKEFIAGLYFCSSKSGKSWKGKDPRGQLEDVSETIRSFDGGEVAPHERLHRRSQ